MAPDSAVWPKWEAPEVEVVRRVDAAGVFAPDDVVGGVDGAVVVEVAGEAGRRSSMPVESCEVFHDKPGKRRQIESMKTRRPGCPSSGCRTTGRRWVEAIDQRNFERAV